KVRAYESFTRSRACPCSPKAEHMRNEASPTVVLLARHGHTEAVGNRLVGRLPGIHLSSRGRAEAAALRWRLEGTALGAVYSSPLERALETAEPVAADHGTDVTICD